MVVDQLIKLKERIQFTGWLQYLPIGVLSALSLIFAGILGLFGASSAALVFVAIGLVWLLIFSVELVTIKWKFRLPERRPSRNDELDAFDLMRARVSCRSFQTRRMDEEDRVELMGIVEKEKEARDPFFGSRDVRFEYVAVPLTVWPVVNASEFLVAVAPKEYQRQAVIEVGFRLQRIVIEATRMGLATCWIGPGADQSSVQAALGDRFHPDADHIVCVCAVGYKSRYLPLFIRSMVRTQHRRHPVEELFFRDVQMTEGLHPGEEPFSHFGRSYEVCQWSPSSFNGQTTRCVAHLAGPIDRRRLVGFDFYAITKSRYYAPVALGIWCANWDLSCRTLGIPGHFVQPEPGGGAKIPEEDLPHFDARWVLEEPMEVKEEPRA